MRSLLILALGLAVAVAAPSNPQRIVGGSITSIDQYPMAVVMLFASLGSQNFLQSCGGSIINNRSILSAAHCFYFNLGNIHIQHRTFQWRARVGSTYAHSGGVVHTIASFISHPQYNARYQDHDIAIVRITSPFSMNNNVRPGAIPGPDYKLLDNEVVWAIGWGQLASDNYDLTEELRHVQVWTVNQTVCNTIYGGIVTDNMLCSGWLNVGGRDQCQGDSGGPLLHNNVIVGISAWGNGCGEKDYPGVNTRVSRYSNWIQSSS